MDLRALAMVAGVPRRQLNRIKGFLVLAQRRCRSGLERTTGMKYVNFFFILFLPLFLFQMADGSGAWACDSSSKIRTAALFPSIQVGSKTTLLGGDDRLQPYPMASKLNRGSGWPIPCHLDFLHNISLLSGYLFISRLGIESAA